MAKKVRLKVYKKDKKYFFRFDGDMERQGPYKESLLIALAKFHFSPKEDFISPNCSEVVSVILQCP